MRKFFLSGTLFLLCLLIPNTSLAADKVAVATKVSGMVQHQYGNKPKGSVLKPGTVLEDGDLVKTGVNGYATLIFIDDKSMLKVKENTAIKIQGKREATSISKKIDMEKGTLRAKVSEQRQGDFVIQTPTSVASVKGTDFWILSDPFKGDMLIGIAGIVTFTNVFSGESLDIFAGITGNSAPDGSLSSEKTDPVTIPVDPGEDSDEQGRSQLKIQFKGPNNQLKTLIIEYQ